MRRLQKRIRQQPQTSRGQISGGGAASPGGTPMTMPLSRVVTSVPAGQYVTLGYATVPPLWTTDGAAVPSTAPGRWGQLAAAGRP
jgi:hypothetical protein